MYSGGHFAKVVMILEGSLGKGIVIFESEVKKN